MSDLNVRTEAVVRVLQEEGVVTSIDGDEVTVRSSDGREEVLLLPPGREATGRTISRLATRYAVARQRFFAADRAIDADMDGDGRSGAHLKIVKEPSKP